jgi:hypothetical protein
MKAQVPGHARRMAWWRRLVGGAPQAAPGGAAQRGRQWPRELVIRTLAGLERAAPEYRARYAAALAPGGLDAPGRAACGAAAATLAAQRIEVREALPSILRLLPAEQAPARAEALAQALIECSVLLAEGTDARDELLLTPDEVDLALQAPALAAWRASVRGDTAVASARLPEGPELVGHTVSMLPAFNDQGTMLDEVERELERLVPEVVRLRAARIGGDAGEADARRARAAAARAARLLRDAGRRAPYAADWGEPAAAGLMLCAQIVQALALLGYAGTVPGATRLLEERCAPGQLADTGASSWAELLCGLDALWPGAAVSGTMESIRVATLVSSTLSDVADAYPPLIAGGGEPALAEAARIAALTRRVWMETERLEAYQVLPALDPRGGLVALRGAAESLALAAADPGDPRVLRADWPAERLERTGATELMRLLAREDTGAPELTAWRSPEAEGEDATEAQRRALVPAVADALGALGRDYPALAAAHAPGAWSWAWSTSGAPCRSCSWASTRS